MSDFENLDYHQSTPGILFADDFDEDAEPAADTPPAPADPPATIPTQAEIEAACQMAREGGQTAAMATVEARVALATADALDRISEMMETARQDAATCQQQSIEVICRLILDTLMAMLPSLRARHAPGEIAAIVGELIGGMTPETAICVTVSAEIAEPVRHALMGLRPDLGKRVAIATQDGMEPGDAKFTWETGAASRNARQVQEGIVAILDRFALLEPRTPRKAHEATWGGLATPAEKFETRESIDA